MTSVPKCPQCSSEHVYEDRSLWICPECAHEWSQSASSESVEQGSGESAVHDAHGNILNNGDSVTVIKDLKVKGSSLVIKVGTKIKNIRLIDGAGDHNIACKIDGIGSMNLKSEFVKKT